MSLALKLKYSYLYNYYVSGVYLPFEYYNLLLVLVLFLGFLG